MNETEREPIRLEEHGPHFNAWRGAEHVATIRHRHDAERFAASDELLAVCRRVSAHFDGTDSPLGIAARAAIALAEGAE